MSGENTRNGAKDAVTSGVPGDGADEGMGNAMSAKTAHEPDDGAYYGPDGGAYGAPNGVSTSRAAPRSQGLPSSSRCGRRRQGKCRRWSCRGVRQVFSVTMVNPQG